MHDFQLSQSVGHARLDGTWLWSQGCLGNIALLPLVARLRAAGNKYAYLLAFYVVTTANRTEGQSVC